MARPREFDIDTALTDAMNVFWNLGYDGATLPLLLDGMSLTRGSLYKAFVDKKSLFLDVLDRYEQEAVVPAVKLLSDTDKADGLHRIEQLFNTVVDAVKNDDYRGCLLCSTAAGAASYDEEVASTVHRMLSQMQHGFETAINQSEKFATLNDQSRGELAHLYLTQYVGLRVLARSKASVVIFEQSVAALMKVAKAQ